MRRRQLARRAAAALLAAGLTGRGGGTVADSPSAAPPSAASGAVQLVAAIQNLGTEGYGGALQAAVEAYLAARFAAAHRGVSVVTLPGPSRDRTDLGYQATIQAVLGGQGPDILCGSGYQFPAFAAAGALAPLEPFVQRDRVRLDRFTPAHLQVLQQPPRGLLALPAYDAPDALLVNLTALADAGLKVPDDDWTYVDAARLWAALTGERGGRWHYGVSLDLGDWVTTIFGGQLMDSSHTRCLLDRPAVLAAAHWMVPLLRQRIADPVPNPPVADLPVRQGSAAFGMSTGANIPLVLRDMRALGVRWDWLPMPFFRPGHRATYLSGGWYGMNAYTRHPAELVWQLLRFIATDAGLQQLLFRLTYVQPSRTDLWDDWLAVVRAVAPELRDKRLECYRDALAYALPNQYFRYEPYVAYTILEFWLGAVYAGRIAPEVGLVQAARHVNRLEAQAAATAGAQAQQAQQAAEAKVPQGFGGTAPPP